MDEDEEKWQKILEELKSSEIKDCVPCAEELMKKRPIRHSHVLDFFTSLVKSLPSKKPRTARQQAPRFKPTFCYVLTGETYGSHETIVEKVKKRKWRSLKWVRKTKTVQKCDIIIVFCPISSRTGSDSEAVKRHEAVSSTNKPVIVVMMHHTRDEEFSPGGRKWFEDPRFVLEVHVLFHDTQRGLLQCAHNKQAVREIKNQVRNPYKNLM
ncbi:uncharacterized protein LOC114426660 [Parambassis ranga]|uniref:Uncharacterized protein LOC114426660 n=1 Tax=Parambassis ranga TaxID=210632 RepID=A0A6P7H4I6_9TELE|nr:uncharacterized protein LOC114426660 [Parambassis ranga]